MLWLVAVTVAVAVQLMAVDASRQIKQLVIAGYLLRIVVAILQTYYPYLLPAFMTEGDESKFLEISTAYYYGDFSEYSTNFPIVLCKLFYITGTGEFPSRILFVYLWFWGFILLQKMVGCLKGKRHWFLILFYSLLPWALYMSTTILRESIKMYSLMLSLFFLRKWMLEGKNRNIILAVVSSVPALWLHNGDVAIVAVIFLTAMLWDTKRQKWDLTRFNWKKLMIVAAIAGFPIIYNVFVALFPGKFNGAFSLDYLINTISLTEGRTTYVPLAASAPTDIWEFLWWTPYRMIYFWVSPTPSFWLSAGDVVAFMADTIPWAIFFMYMLRAIRRKRLGEEAKIAILIFLSFTFIYAWGTSNAGTALRHRDHLLGLFVMAGLMEKGNNMGNERKTMCQRVSGNCESEA